MGNEALHGAHLVLAMDVDGVLLDGNRGGRGGWQTTLSDRFGIAPDDLRRAFFAQHWADVVTGREGILPALTAALAELGAPASARDVLDHWLATDFVLDDAAIDAVGRWSDSGVPVVLATNQDHERAAFLQRELGRLVRLDGVAHSAALGVTKDDPEFYRRARRHLGIDARATIVFVDDDPGNVRTATETGWIAVWRCDGDDWIGNVDQALGDRQ